MLRGDNGMNDFWLTVFFFVFPWISITIFVAGFAYRYFWDQFNWNSQSSQLLEKNWLKWGSVFFHYGILGSFVGHVIGLLVPQQYVWRGVFGIPASTHETIAYAGGMVLGGAAFLGIVILLVRHISIPRILRTTTTNTFVTVLLILLPVFTGVLEVYILHDDMLVDVAPWIQSVMTFRPDPEHASHMALAYKIHVLSAFALFAFSPFSRLVHVWSVPVWYFLRPYISFRRYRRAAS